MRKKKSRALRANQTGTGNAMTLTTHMEVTLPPTLSNLIYFAYFANFADFADFADFAYFAYFKLVSNFLLLLKIKLFVLARILYTYTIISVYAYPAYVN